MNVLPSGVQWRLRPRLTIHRHHAKGFADLAPFVAQQCSVQSGLTGLEKVLDYGYELHQTMTGWLDGAR